MSKGNKAAQVRTGDSYRLFEIWFVIAKNLGVPHEDH